MAYGSAQVLLLVIALDNLYVLRGYVDTYKVTLVPDVVCIHPDVVSVICKNGKMIVISLIKKEVYSAGKHSVVRVVNELDLVELHFHLHLLSRCVCGLWLAVELLVKESDLVLW